MKPQIKRIHCAWCDDYLDQHELEAGDELICDWCATLPRYKREDRIEYEVDLDKGEKSQVF